jgi:hypothetical protein
MPPDEPIVTPPVVVPPSTVPQTFSLEYVKELREENKTRRIKETEHENALKAALESAAKAKEESDTRVSATEKAANERIIRAEMKAAALKAGMVDLDGLKLADLSKVKLLEDGTIEGADELMAAMKEAKPYLFGAPTGTSHNGTPPPPKTPVAKKATEMTDEEYAVARKAIK